MFALWSFTAENANELSFKAGDEMEIVSDQECEWITVRDVIGRVGKVPANYIVEVRSSMLRGENEDMKSE